jgi:putative flippase GtrA
MQRKNFIKKSTLLSLRKLFQHIEFIRFIYVGVVNTFLSLAIMFSMYHLFKLGYWESSSIAYAIGSAVSFALNRNFTFHYKGSTFPAAIKFASINTISYLVAYGIAKLVTSSFLYDFNCQQTFTDQIAMCIGMVLFVIFNYFGQKYFVFKNNEGNSTN